MHEFLNSKFNNFDSENMKNIEILKDIDINSELSETVIIPNA